MTRCRSKRRATFRACRTEQLTYDRELGYAAHTSGRQTERSAARKAGVRRNRSTIQTQELIATILTRWFPTVGAGSRVDEYWLTKFKVGLRNWLAEGAVTGLAEDVNHGLEGEPIRDLLAGPQHAAELGAGQLDDLLAALLGDRLLDVDLAVVDHVLVVRDGHAQLGRELLASLLRIVRTVEVIASDGALGASHVTADDEVGGAVVLADDHVLDRLAGPSHLHAVGQVGPAEHGVLLRGLLCERLVGLDADKAINVTRLRGAARGVDEQGAAGHVLLRADQELEVGAVDRVPVLEGHHVALGQRGAHLRRGLSDVRELRALDAVELAADVGVAKLRDEREDGGVLQAGGAVALLGLHDLVGLEHGGGLQHGDILAIPLQKNLLTHLHAHGAAHVEDNRHAEELLLRQAHARHNGLVLGLVHEAREGAEGTVHQAEDIAGLALVELDGLGGAGNQGLGLGRIRDQEVDQVAAMRGTGRGRAGVDAALGLGLAHEAAGALALVRLDGDRGVGVAERLEDVGDARRGGALDLRLRAPPEGLAQGHLLPGQVRQVAGGRLDRLLAPVGEAVPLVHGDAVLVNVLGDVLPGEIGHGVESGLALLPHVKGDALRRLVHAAAGDEDVLLALRQRTLEGLHLAHKVEVSGVHLLDVAVLRLELHPRGDVRRHLPDRLLLVLLLHLIGDGQGRREEVQRVDGDEVHALQDVREVLLHQRHEDVVRRQPRRGEDDVLPVLRQVLLDGLLEAVHLDLQLRGARGEAAELQLQAGDRRGGARGPQGHRHAEGRDRLAERHHRARRRSGTGDLSPAGQ
mmetsp:Transcript_19901/g.52833  ORF Transcript_19901/g.52833 Transcript_19901/m.52833 type:complete len:805 (+) Transcript_19901:239-2653(+)